MNRMWKRAFAVTLVYQYRWGAEIPEMPDIPDFVD